MLRIDELIEIYVKFVEGCKLFISFYIGICVLRYEDKFMENFSIF